MLVGPPETIQAAAGAIGAASVYGATPVAPDGPGGPPGGAAPVPPATATDKPKPKTPDGQAGPAPNVDSKFDPLVVVYATKPATVQDLVKRMGELLYGEEVPPAARAKVEKFLLGGKPTVTAEDLEKPAFKQRAREALHALMCLPDYQLA